MTLSIFTAIIIAMDVQHGQACHSSSMRDLIQVLSLPRVEKLLSALAVLTGKVKSIAKNVWVKGNVCWSQAAKPSAAVSGIAPSGRSDNWLDHFCHHKASFPSSVNWYIDSMIPLYLRNKRSIKSTGTSVDRAMTAGMKHARSLKFDIVSSLKRLCMSVMTASSNGR